MGMMMIQHQIPWLFRRAAVLLVDLGQKLVIPEQAQLLLAHLDRGAAVLRNQHLVTDGHAWCHSLSIAVQCSRAYGEDLGFVELLDGGLGEEDAGCGFRLGLEALDEDAVEKRGNGADGLDCRHFGGVGKKAKQAHKRYRRRGRRKLGVDSGSREEELVRSRSSTKCDRTCQKVDNCMVRAQP